MELSSSESKSLVPGESSAAVRSRETNLPPFLRGWMRMPRSRQIGLLMALALSIAVGVAVLLWAQRPDYAVLFGELPEKEAGEIVETLQKLNVETEIDSVTGAVRVPADQVHALRLKLAGMGLPRQGNAGFELLDRENGFGTSQFMEGARYQHALEGEIARSIMTIRNVKSARVHLALPKESVFVRQARKSSASVVVDLQPGRALEPGQVEAIVHLVAASVPQLEPGQVTVVDQGGHLLSERDPGNEAYLSGKQFDYKRQVEEHLIERIENILSPVVGSDGMRTQVSADIDFTVTERTQEVYNPDSPALRSEQTSEDRSRGAAGVQGVPGALSNQPPPAGVAPETTAQPAQGGQAAPTAAPQPAQGAQAAAAPELPTNASKSATRNYELDKTISHSRLGTGGIRRITVAVVLDHRHVPKEGAGPARQPYSEEDLNRFSDLVKQAVGFDAARGDRVTVIDAAFREEPALPAPQMWDQTWFWPLIKQVGAILAVILLIFGVLRPAVKGLVRRAESEQGQGSGEPGGQVREGVLAAAQGTGVAALGADEQEEILMLEAPQSHEKRIEFAQRAIDQDPRRVAQVIKNWMSGNG